MSKLLEEINKYRVRCEGCEHFYQTIVIGGLRKLLHARVGLDQTENDDLLPTRQCRMLYDFVRFDPCNHCCPEVFAQCPEAHEAAPGKPTQDGCGG